MLNQPCKHLTLAVLTALSPGLSAAQSGASGDTSVQDLDSVSVTGIRSAIEAAIVTKLTENTIVEAISAEDIGKLPDTSIADSLARLPGLAAQRFGGRPQEINIRGFAGDFSTALLNGREQVSFGHNRGVEFDQYPSELMSQVVVHKTTNAQLVGQGLSGTVNMKTVRPLDYGRRAAAFNMRGDMNRLSDQKQYGNRFSAAYIDQFRDNTLGIAVGFAHMDSPSQIREYASWGYRNGVIGGSRIYKSQMDNERNGVMTTLQFRPNGHFDTSLDIFWSKFKREEVKWGVEYGLAYGNGSVLDDAQYQNDTTIHSRWSNVSPIIARNDYNPTDDALFSIGWNTRINMGDHWVATADVSHSRARREEMGLEVYAGLSGGRRDTVEAIYNPKGWYDTRFGRDYGDVSELSFFDPGRWGGQRAQAAYQKNFLVKDKLSSIRLDFGRLFDAGIVSGLRFGANYTDRAKNRGSDEYTLCTTMACLGTDNIEMPVPSQYVLGTDFGFAGIDRVPRLDMTGLLNDGIHYRLGKDDPGISNKNWQIDENLSTFYTQIDLDGGFGAVSVKGNIGLQAVRVNQESEGIATFDGSALGDPNRQRTSYTHYLPSTNLSFGLPFEQFVRVGASRQMARPRMDQMAANSVFSFDVTRQRWIGSGGNPAIKSWLADAFDVSWEKYFAGGKGYVSLAWFYKDLSTYIYTQTVDFDFSQLPIDPAVLASYSPSTMGEYSQPVNGEGGLLKGHEVAISLPLELLWQPLQGFGIVGSYSDTSSSIQPNGPGRTEPLPGLSRYISSLTGYYEHKGFSIRLSSRHRSQFLGEVQGGSGDRTRMMFESETVTDLQLGYVFQSGALENLSLLLQVNNLENEPFRSNRDGINERVNRYYEYGRTYLFGVNYRF